MRRVPILLLFIVSMIGCSTQPEKIEKQSFILLTYQDYTCKQIGVEIDRVNGRSYELFGSLKNPTNNNETQMAVRGLACFGLPLFVIKGGDDYRAKEYARLKGEREVLEKLAVQKECDPTKLPKFKDPEEEYRKEQKKLQEQHRGRLQEKGNLINL
jgi:hypothetical protein